MANAYNLKAVISAVDQASAPLKKIMSAVQGPLQAMRNLGDAFSNVSANMSGMLGPLTAIAGGGALAGIGFGVKKIVDVSAQFEKFQSILETIEGSSEKAKESMAWVSDFAAKTPYELAEVTDSFVKLKAYGIDAQAGALKSAGDAAAALGKPLEQAVEALADAMMGENERLKEFGVKASVAGDKITYRWNENGKEMVATANKNSSNQIQAVVTGIWNRRYAGAMDKMSTTWSGMWSNLQDNIAQFIKKIGDNGVFDFLKGTLSDVLKQFEQMKADGSLEKLAKDLGETLTLALKDVRDTLLSLDWKASWQGVKDFGKAVQVAVDAIGGWGNAMLAVTAFMMGPFAIAWVQMGAALAKVVWQFGILATGAVAGAAKALIAFLPTLAPVIAATWAWTAALLANPITWIVGGIVLATGAVIALAAGVAWAVTHWEQFEQILKGAGSALENGFGSAVDWALDKLKSLWEGTVKIFDDIKGIFSADWLSFSKPDFGINGQKQGVTGPGFNQTPPSLVRQMSAATANQNQLRGAIDVTFNDAPQGLRVNTKNESKSLPFNVDVGYSSLALGMP